MPPRVISEAEEAELKEIQIFLVNDLWKAENNALDEGSFARQRQLLGCLHDDMEILRVLLNRILHINLTVKVEEQTVPYPFSENGDK